MTDQTVVRLTREQQLALVEQAKESLPAIYTIYDHPRDIPGAFVVRCWYGHVYHPDVFLTQELENAREYCRQRGADFCLLRQREDDPTIVESWI